MKRRVVVAGASGVVGRHIVTLALSKGFEVLTLTRGQAGEDQMGFRRCTWRPAAAAAGEETALNSIKDVIEGASLLVNLAGAGVADRRLTESWKREILQSRLDSTGALVKAWHQCEEPPPVWLQASAVGYYGDTGEAIIDESGDAGDDYLANVCIDWEAAAAAIAEDPRVDGRLRMVVARIGLVFAPDSKPWQEMLRPIKLGLGGPLGSGKQFYPWIDADDLARAVFFVLENDGARGAFNFTGPDPIRQGDLVKKIAARVGRPSFLPAPRFVLRLALGEMADAILSSQRVMPKKLLEAGFVFEKRTFDDQISAIMG